MAAAWTLEEAQEHLATWLAADEAVSLGQEYEIQSGNTRRKLTRANAFQIQRKIEFWTRQVNRLKQNPDGGPTIRYITPE